LLERALILGQHSELQPEDFLLKGSTQSDNPTSPFRGYFHQLEELKHRFPRLRLLISLEGEAQDFAFDAQDL
jgi:hypothetical protein